MIDVSAQTTQANALNNVCTGTLRSIISKCDAGITQAKASGENSYTKQAIKVFEEIKSKVQSQSGIISGAASDIPGIAQRIYDKEYAEWLAYQQWLEEQRQANKLL